MKYGKVLCASLNGIDAILTEVEVDISGGLPGFAVVGMAGKSVGEAKDRVRGALKHSGFKIPAERITINLAPADLKKEGTHYDLAIAICILSACGGIENAIIPQDVMFIGELSLNGKVRGVKGVLVMAELAQNMKMKYLVLPKQNLREASLIQGINLVPIEYLKELVLMLEAGKLLTQKASIKITHKIDSEYDFSLIRGQESAKRALTIASAGGHNLLMSGPPGTGKTLLARTIPTILPTLSKEEMLEVTKIYSVTGKLPKNQAVITQSPFRSPHHTASHVALVGGGSSASPGEVTLAHRGVLFLDEIPEFHRQTLEALRQPLEDGVITVSRASGTLTFPAKFMLIASSNPCPCGYLGDPKKECSCTPMQIIHYQKKLSGPLLDRIDMKIVVERFDTKKFAGKVAEGESDEIRAKVTKARNIQRKRYAKIKAMTNADLKIKNIEGYCQIPETEKMYLIRSMENSNLSARGYHKILKIARTIADLDQSEKIKQKHLFEALSYYDNQALNM
ncbi:hypothetical protein CO101_01095 [Candidatus Berkelbacteria bacterium CG_4_9_14_3_um_filter_39_23]|uniref:AAA+ ATPase domain-containing protein n=3 Tax=Candidatus Berkelbacteria TaxID=1618330 RepID=A0A2M7CHS3_9BACT|nr:YifB family Mg chelatase-like AAA ATPase [Candidatus Berkelbacteria bacterium]OIN90111.1 MAG: hypothetical protein AUJ40_00545 [Candidatus Berkelbacteria bacterium CG1_02_42_45]OIP05359.1 MAG: hypothetical protein AUK14_01745 [Candidatus Berkelbacteria bacterium CG2_30_39_44]PIV25185.1 MAG: hypothetical protein COS38_02975 [Candidatus Berkelbacteria bacterium CG03_land_8_20_14_0_80_40_36]PIZ28712.1 MAG: hypothetical protein COY44_02730 [Candidatus Berkelbacteria bacterium CG_4_10_14_0_8_um_f